ncbi:hypothetical protein ACJRPK_15260 [Aquimarina sp. 2-A2]|uniref:hypothetical protein n=1 Tax=Aquimarina sp. 2-A2 TaxID=3382644 RepID=UPI00387F13C4
MSKKDLDLFLGKKVDTPLNTDKIYGGNASKFDEDIKITIKEGSKVTVIEA